MSLTLQSPTQSEPLQPNNLQFTCIACQVVFPSSESQRTHYRNDWHKYNLKRKLADLSPVTPDQFNAKVLAQQAKGQEEMDRAAIIYHCDICRKTYGTEAAYESHIRSKKHKDCETLQEITAANDRTTIATASAGGSARMSGNEDDLTLSTSLQCLFCNKTQDQFNANLHHMSKDHGFFLPDVEYLSDAEGLVQYLSNKIKSDLSCLYCNKETKSIQATRCHMVDKGHCKMAYDDTEDVDALLQYYDFGNLTDEDNDDQIPKMERNRDGELVLLNGIRLGHRHLFKRYKQKQQQQQQQQSGHGKQYNRAILAADDDGTSQISTTAVVDQKEIQQQQQESESLWKNRYERRHPNLAITDGQYEEHRSKTDAGIQETAKKSEFHHQIGIKQNANNTQRLRMQNPIV